MLSMEKTLERAINFFPPACWDLLLGQVLRGDRFVGPWRPMLPAGPLPGGMLSQITAQRAELSRLTEVRSELGELGGGETILSLSSLELCLRLLLSHRLACSLLSDVIIILIGPNENYTCRGKGITCVPPLNLVLSKLQVTGKKDMCLSVYTYLLCITVALIMTFSPWMHLTRDFLAALGIWGWKKNCRGFWGLFFPSWIDVKTKQATLEA